MPQLAEYRLSIRRIAQNMPARRPLTPSLSAKIAGGVCHRPDFGLVAIEPGNSPGVASNDGPIRGPVPEAPAAREGEPRPTWCQFGRPP
jgi:hypothetical protein